MQKKKKMQVVRGFDESSEIIEMLPAHWPLSTGSQSFPPFIAMTAAVSPGDPKCPLRGRTAVGRKSLVRTIRFLNHCFT